MTYDPHEGMGIAAMIILTGIAVGFASVLLLARVNGYL